MPRRLPPLNALRAFEAAARHLSFTEGAKELNVTQAAISHQVKALEEFLGVELFLRKNRALELTGAGSGYLPPLQEAFDLMDAASAVVRKRESSGPLRVSTMNSFASKWLMPRLYRFRQAHPEIDVLVEANNELSDLLRSDIDLAIRFGYGDYPGLVTEFLARDLFVPLCAPALLTSGKPLRRPEDLVNHTLLHDEVGKDPGWLRWLEIAGAPSEIAGRGPGFSDSSLVVTAAIAGEGVALGRVSLAIEDLRAGRLVAPFGPAFLSDYRYYVVYPPHAADWAKVRAFRDWVFDEMKRDDPLSFDLGVEVLERSIFQA